MKWTPGRVGSRPQISTRTDCLSDIAYHDFVELIWGVDMALSGGDWYHDDY